MPSINHLNPSHTRVLRVCVPPHLMYLSILSSFLLHFDNVVSIIFNLSAASTPSGLIHCCIEVAVACIIPVFNLTIVHVCSNWLQSSPQSHSPPWSATVDNPSAFSPLALFVSVFVGFCHCLLFFCPCWFLFFCLCLSSLLPLLLTFSSPYFLIFSSVCSFLLQVFSGPSYFIPSVFRFLLHWVSCVSVSAVFLWGTSPSSSVTMYQIRSYLKSLPFSPTYLLFPCYLDVI